MRLLSQWIITACLTSFSCVGRSGGNHSDASRDDREPFVEHPTSTCPPPLIRGWQQSEYYEEGYGEEKTSSSRRDRRGRLVALVQLVLIACACS